MAGRDGAQAADLVAGAVKRKPVNGARKGADFERDIVAYLVALGYGNARRMIRTGTVKHQDEGDIDGVPFTIQAKDWTRRAPKGISDAQLLEIWRATRKQAATRQHTVCVIVEKVARQPITHAWAHLNLHTLSVIMPGVTGVPLDYGAAGLLVTTRTRMRFGEFMRLLMRMYPPT